MRLSTGFGASRRLTSLLMSGFGCLFLGSSLVWGAGVSDLLQTYRVQPIDPPRPAADFSLPGFAGGERSLSDFGGQWVVLTFWASWCGPCRAEMPSLEALHRSHAKKGVAIVGVSVDQDRAAGAAFIEEHQLTFPQFWDQASRVGRTYQATAIPMSYLVDPAGRVVAVSRGARDWTELAPLMDSLIEQVPPGSTAEAEYAAALEMPEVENPPTAEIVLSSHTPRAGQEFHLDVHLRWAGTLQEYLPQTPQVYLPEGVIQKGVTASTSSREGDQVLVYRFTLQAEETGSFALDPVELRYQPRWAADVATSRLEGPTITVAEPTVLGLTPRNLVLAAGGVAVTAAAGLVIGWWWSSKRGPPSPTAVAGYEDWMARYREARAVRMRGDGAGFALAMIDLLRELGEPAETERVEMAALEERLRFGGEVPAASDLDRMQRSVSRRLEALRPDPDRVAREALRLQDEERS